MEAFASMESHVGARRHYTTTGEAAVLGMARPAVGAVIEVFVVVSFMMLPITIVPPIAKVLPITVPPVSKVLPIVVVPIAKVASIAKVTKVSIKIMVKVAKE
jgi:hypothetical protein